MNEKMRTIKFRSWDGERMCTPFGLDFVVSKKDGDWKFTDDNVFMQYTGMLDKNKKQIYEGDILKCKAKLPKRAGEEFYNIVDYYEGITFYGFRMKRGRFTAPLTPSRIYNGEAEIIGNIYENPELLNI